MAETLSYVVNGKWTRLADGREFVTWSGQYDGRNVCGGSVVLTDCVNGVTRHIRATKGQMYVTQKNCVTGSVSIDGEEWTFAFENFGYSLEKDGAKKRTSNLNTLLRELAEDRTSIQFGELKGEASCSGGGKVPSPSTSNSGGGGGGGGDDKKPDPDTESSDDTDSDSDPIGGLFDM